MKTEVVSVAWDEYREQLRSIRTSVFIDEQGVPEKDEWDSLDAGALHFIAFDSDKAIGCLRLLRHGKLTRMAVLAPYRNAGVGTALLEAAERHCQFLGLLTLRADAQVAALPFYTKHGYTVVSDTFIDAGIVHKSIEKSLPRLEQSHSITRYDSPETARVAIAESLSQGQSSVALLTNELSRALYDNEAFSTALSKLARNSELSCVRILLKDSRALHGRAHAVTTLANRLPSKIELKILVSDEIDAVTHSFLAIDSESLIYFNDENQFKGFINHSDRAEVKHLMDEFNYLWEHHAKSDVHLRNLTL